MRIVSSATRDTLDPHLIVQYPEGATVRVVDGAVTAPASNRLIFANDAPNREMAIADGLGDALEGAAAFLVSGFNTMQDADLLEARLDDLAAAMQRLPADALVYYEDAGFYRREFSAHVRRRLLERVDVYGMNEDELQEYLGRSVDLLSPDDVGAALAEAHHLIPARALIVHTKYWALAVGPSAARHAAGLESAVRTAATRYRLGDACTAADLDVTAGLGRHPGGPRSSLRSDEAVGRSAVPAYLIDTADPTTIGWATRSSADSSPRFRPLRGMRRRRLWIALSTRWADGRAEALRPRHLHRAAVSASGSENGPHAAITRRRLTAASHASRGSSCASSDRRLRCSGSGTLPPRAADRWWPRARGAS